MAVFGLSYMSLNEELKKELFRSVNYCQLYYQYSNSKQRFLEICVLKSLIVLNFCLADRCV